MGMLTFNFFFFFHFSLAKNEILSEQFHQVWTSFVGSESLNKV